MYILSAISQSYNKSRGTAERFTRADHNFKMNYQSVSLQGGSYLPQSFTMSSDSRRRLLDTINPGASRTWEPWPQ